MSGEDDANTGSMTGSGVARAALRGSAYARLRGSISAINAGLDRDAAMRSFVEVAWRELAPTGVSWLGFYVGEPEAEELVLAAREPKPACSPIGMHGACGRCFRSRKPLVVRDVAELGANYVACDPRDRSELVLPCLDERGRAWGVLDLDSHDLAAFDDEDAAALSDLLRLAGLSR